VKEDTSISYQLREVVLSHYFSRSDMWSIVDLKTSAQIICTICNFVQQSADKLPTVSADSRLNEW